MITIRKALPTDARALADLAESTFRATFEAASTAEEMELHCRGNYAETIQAAEIGDPGVVTLLGESNGALIGFAQLRWGKAPSCVPATTPGEIH